MAFYFPLIRRPEAAPPMAPLMTRTARVDFHPNKGFPWACFLSLAVVASCVLALSPAHADAPRTQLKVRMEKVLTGKFLYWFMAPSQPATEQKPLPDANTDGVITLDVPAAYNKAKAELVVLDISHDRMAHLTLADKERVLSLEPRTTLGPNLIQNGDFSADKDHWMTDTNLGTARGTLQLASDIAGPPGVTGKVARFKVDAIDKNNWHVQLFQDNLDLTEGEPYQLTFWARADQPRPLTINGQVAAEDYHMIGLQTQVHLTADWQKFVMAMTPTRVLKGVCRIAFEMGDAIGTVDLAGISLQQGLPAPPLGPNMLRNPNFETTTEAWEPNLNFGMAHATLDFPDDITPPPGVQGKVAHINVTVVDDTSWHVQIFQGGLDMDDGEPYTVSFWAKSDRERTISLYMQIAGGDFHGIGLAPNINLTKEWRQYTFTFKPDHTVKGNNRITINMGNTMGTVDLTGFAIRHGEGSATASGTNLLRNADFTRDGRYWKDYLSSDTGHASLEFPTDISTPTGVAGKVARLKVTSTGHNPWDLQLIQDSLDMQEGQPYTVSFWARSDHERTILCSTEANFHTAGLWKEVTIGPEWRNFTLVFNAAQIVSGQNSLKFMVGNATGPVDLAGVVLQPGMAVLTYTGGSNLEKSLAFADFRYAHTVRLAVKEKSRTPDAKFKPAQSATVILHSHGQTLGIYQLKPVDKGIASFTDVPIGDPINVKVSIGSHSADFARTLAADASGVLPPIALAANWWQVKSVESPAAPSLSESGSHPLIGMWQSRSANEADRYRFTFHEDGTGSILTGKSIPNPGTPPEANAIHAFRWYVRPNGHRVVISSKEYIWAISSTDSGTKLTLTDMDGKTHVLYRQ